MDAEFCVMWQDQVVLLLLLPDPFRGMGNGGRPWSLRSQATPQGLDRQLHQSTAASTWWCGPRPRLV